MRLFIKTCLRKLGTGFAALTWLATGLLTIGLFLETGHPVPDIVCSWGDSIDASKQDDRGWPLERSDLIRLSRSGQVAAVIKPTRWEGGKRECEIDFLDVPSWERRCSLTLSPNCLKHFAVSPQGGLMVVSSEEGPVQLFAWPSGKSLGCLITRGTKVERLAFSHSGKELLVATYEDLGDPSAQKNRCVSSIDLETRKEVCTYKSSSGGRLVPFFDSEDRPKFLETYEFRGGLESILASPQLMLWDIRRGVQEAILNVPSRGVASPSDFCFTPRNDFLADEIRVSQEIQVWSLADWSIVGRIAPLQGYARPLALSTTARYEADNYYGRIELQHGHLLGDFLGLVKQIYDPLGESVRGSAVREVRTGKSWVGLPEAFAAAFIEGDTKLVTLTEEGRYIWDVPPRWRFSPWTWVALAGWFGLSWMLWRLWRPRVAMIGNAENSTC